MSTVYTAVQPHVRVVLMWYGPLDGFALAAYQTYGYQHWRPCNHAQVRSAILSCSCWPTLWTVWSGFPVSMEEL